MADVGISSGMVITFHYDLYDENSEKIESSLDGDPLVFLFGEQSILSALQDAFIGKLPGDDFSITIPHEKAYGRYYPERVQRVAKKTIDGGKQRTFRVGELITLRSQSGAPQTATVVKNGKFNLDIDANHPLAGQDLTFDVKIIDSRAATDDELAHGHAHGPGGHHHH